MKFEVLPPMGLYPPFSSILDSTPGTAKWRPARGHVGLWVEFQKRRETRASWAMKTSWVLLLLRVEAREIGSRVVPAQMTVKRALRCHDRCFSRA